MSDTRGFSDPTIQALVDVLSGSLNSLSDKINSYQPVLQQIEKNVDTKTITEIDFQLKQLSKTFSEFLTEFYNRTSALSQDNKDILDLIKKTQEKIDNINNNFNSNLQSLNTTISTNFQALNSNIVELQAHTKPVGKFVSWLSKPLGIIIFIIGMVLASITVNKTVQGILNYFERPVQNVVPSNTSN